MGVNLRDLLVRHEIEIPDLQGKKLAFDAFNILYQFLSTIRQRDGTPLMDSHGNVTSHLSGLFYRLTNLMAEGIQPVFVFDGQPPEEKAQTRQKREQIRTSAGEKHQEALKKGAHKEAMKYAQQTARLNQDIIRESKELLSAMGIPWVQAISEGEAQAAYLCRKGLVWGMVSQDYDALLFGTTRVVRNLTISGKRKLPGKAAYVTVKPELIELTETLNFLGIDITSLIKIAVLIGTDYNEGIKGVGPKTALKIVKEKKFDEYKNQIKNADKIINIFKSPPITTDYTLEWRPLDTKKILHIMCDRHDFAKERIETQMKKITKAKKRAAQSGLGSFI
jgi:flap endonuclease-1